MVESETEEEQIESPEFQTGFEMPSTYDYPETYIEKWRNREVEQPEMRLRSESSSSNNEDDQASTNP